MKLAATGGAGFIGSNFIHYFLSKYRSDTITNLDKLTYSGNPENLRDLEKDPRYCFRKVDICDPRRLRAALVEDHFDVLVHFAAESHVDRSILNSAKFVKTNVLGTQCLLEAARDRGVRRFIYVSTDEVYGSAPLQKDSGKTLLWCLVALTPSARPAVIFWPVLISRRW